jgi:hypothetical protein
MDQTTGGKRSPDGERPIAPGEGLSEARLPTLGKGGCTVLSNWKSIGLVLLLGLIAWLATGCGEGSSSSQTTTVSGTITDDVGVPMQSATVTAVQRSSSTLAVAQTANQASTVTDSKGHYELTVPEGDVEKIGRASCRERVS